MTFESCEKEIRKDERNKFKQTLEEVEMELIKDNSFVRLSGDDLLNEFNKRVKKRFLK